jgi:hypothetical protein
MSGPRHTPGPWFRDPETEEFNVTNEDGVGVIWGCGCCGSPQVMNPADESLILAAPDLLEGARLAVEKLESMGLAGSVECKRIRASIDKAEGRTT